MTTPVLTGKRWLDVLEDLVKNVRIPSKEDLSDDGDAGVPLILWDSQERFLKEVAAGLDAGIHIFICLKSRQLGVTTLSLLIDLAWLALHDNLTCALVTENEKNREKNRKLLKKYVNSFPPNYFGEEFRITRDNRSSMEFSNGSRIDFLVAGTKEKGTSWSEGEGYAFAHLTEVAAYASSAAIESFEEAFAQTNPHRLYIYESTAKGFNHWKRKWDAAVADIHTTRAFFLGWWSGKHNSIPRSDPRYLQYGTYPASGEEREKVAEVKRRYGHVITPEQLAWVRWRDANADDDQMLKQNQPWLPEEAFIASGYSFFQVRQITKDLRVMDEAAALSRKTGEPNDFMFQGYRYELGSSFFDVEMVPEETDIDAVELRVWEQPHPDGKYVIGCDPAWGRNDHKDRHAISVWRCYADCLVQVAEYATNEVEPKHCAWVLAHLAGAYKNCLVNPEIGGPGRMLMQEWDHIRQILTAEMFERETKERDWEDALNNARWYLFHRPDQPGAGYVYAFETTWKTKQEIMFQMRGEYVTGNLVIRSRKLLEEMQNVVHDDGQIGAPESRDEDSKDDRVFAGALANRAWLNWIRPSMIANGETREIMSRRESGERPRQADRVINQVYGFFARMEQIKENPDLYMTANQRFLSDRGL